MFKKIILAASIFATAACSSGIKDSLGIHNSAPDEFRVVSNAPLSVPPEFNLRPPVPGAKRPQEVDLQQQAKDVLFENQQKSATAGDSKGESTFLKRADIAGSNPNIRNVLTEDERAANNVVKEKSFFEKLRGYLTFHKDENKEPVVNADKERERIEENKKEGKPANEGEVPVVKEGKGGLLNNVFGF